MKTLKIYFANGTAKYTIDKTEELVRESRQKDYEVAERMFAHLNGREKCM